MDPKAIWFFCFVGMMFLSGGIGGLLAYKKVKYSNILSACIVGITLYLGFELLFYLDQPENVNPYFRVLLAPVLGVIGFCVFLYFINILRPSFRKKTGLDKEGLQ